MLTLLSGKFFTYLIMSLYAIRCGSYMWTGHYGPGAYWASALCITISAEFLMARWP